MRTRPALLALALLLSVACSEKDPVDPVAAAYRAAVRVGEEAAGLRKDGKEAAAQETFRRAWDRMREVLPLVPERSDRGGIARPDVLNQLSWLSVELADSSPVWITRAVRYADRALASADWALPHLNRGLACSRAGLHGRAVKEIEHGLSLLPEKERPSREPMLRQALYNEASSLVRSPGPGDAAAARRLLERAWDLKPDAAANAPVFRALAALQERFEAEADAAQEAGDWLELARIHAEYGFPEDAERYLVRARNDTGRTEEVRWIAARYVNEIPGTPEGLAAAARIYEEMIGRGERLPQTTAGWARVMRKLGRIGPALERYGEMPEPGALLRAELVRLRLESIRSMPPDAKAAAEKEFARIDDLFLGGLDPEDRAELLVSAAFLAADRGAEERLRGWIREFQSRDPNDLRATILEARLEELAGAPLPGEEE